LKKKADKEQQSFFERFCSAQENKARASLIIAAAIVVALLGSVCTAAIRLNSATEEPSENVELNAAEQYLARVAMETNVTGNAQIVDIPVEYIEETTATVNSMPKKQGGLTGAHVVDISDLKSLTDEELVDAIVSGKAGVIDRSQIETDQSQDSKPVHSGAVGEAPAATDTPTPVPTNVPTPTMAPITMVRYELGIDVSGWNGTINWSKVADAGITFAFIRCGGRGYGSAGNTYEDSMFSTNIRNAKAAGIKVGVYFFSQAITPYEALEEASLTLAKLGGMSLDLPVVMDWETEYDGEHRTEHLGTDDFYNVVLAFCSTIAQNGYTPMLYLDGGNINRLGGHLGDVLSRYRLWYAYPYAVYNPYSSSYEKNMYEAGDTVPPRSYSYEYWQYSWWGDVPGISGHVDLNLRILGKVTLEAPEITVENEDITSAAGQSVDLLEGVYATTSQGDSSSDVSYEIKDSNDQTVSLEQAQKTRGTYKVIYSYQDSFRGIVTASAAWTVTDAVTTTPGQTVTPVPEGGTVTPAPSPSVTPEVSVTPTPSPSPSPSPSDVPGEQDTPETTESVPENTDSTTTADTPPESDGTDSQT